jgi:hypothetical protein
MRLPAGFRGLHRRTRGLAADTYGLDDSRARRDLCHSVMRSSGTAIWTTALGSGPSRNMGPSAAGI